jgi:hypothetical protein
MEEDRLRVDFGRVVSARLRIVDARLQLPHPATDIWSDRRSEDLSKPSMIVWAFVEA